MVKGLSASSLKCPYNNGGNTADDLRVVKLRFSSYMKNSHIIPYESSCMADTPAGGFSPLSPLYHSEAI
jgi:hypothetical protein